MNFNPLEVLIFHTFDDVEKATYFSGKLEIHKTRERQVATVLYLEVQWRSDTSHGHRREDEEVTIKSMTTTRV